MSRTRSAVSVFKQLIDYIAVRVADELAIRARPRRETKVVNEPLKRGRRRRGTLGKMGKKGKLGAMQCSAANCPKPARAKGLCTRHYQKARYNALKAGAKK